MRRDDRPLKFSRRAMLAPRHADAVVGFSVADMLVRLLVGPLSALAAAVLYFEL